jgi:DNA-binding transcriptional regulator YiaG
MAAKTLKPSVSGTKPRATASTGPSTGTVDGPLRLTGAEIRFLRQAMRMSVREFAGYLGAGDCMVSKWESGGEDTTPRPVNQAALVSTNETSVSREDQQVHRYRVYCDRLMGDRAQLERERCRRRNGHIGDCDSIARRHA